MSLGFRGLKAIVLTKNVLSKKEKVRVNKQQEVLIQLIDSYQMSPCASQSYGLESESIIDQSRYKIPSPRSLTFSWD